MWTITSFATGRTITLSRDVATEHPAWVHEQCGTASECELQHSLDQYDVETCRGKGPDICGITWKDEDEDEN